MIKRNIARTMLSVSGVVTLAKILGFIKQIITANAFGATNQTDLISLSEGIISNTDYLLIQALSTAFIPIYITARVEGQDVEKRFVSNTIKVFFLLTVIISLLFFLFSPFISRVLAPSYSVAQSRALAKYIRLFSPILIVIVETSIFNALLKANESFIPGELLGLNQSVILIIFVLAIGDVYGPDTLVFASFTYSIFNLGYLMIVSRKYWSISVDNPFEDEYLIKLVKMMGPLILGYSMIFVNQQVDKIIVSGLVEGTVTAMNYASVLSNFVCTFIGSICGILFTYITKNTAEGKDKTAAELTIESTIEIGIIVLPLSIIVLMNTPDIVTIVFGRGKFDSRAIESCSDALAGYSFMFFPFLIRELFSRFHYAYNDSKTPMINSTISIFANIFLSVFLSKRFGVIGVTFATSVSVFLNAILNIYSAKKRNAYVVFSKPSWYIMRSVIGLILCFTISVLGQNIFKYYSAFARFLVVSMLALSIYIAVVFPIIRPLLIRLRGKQ